MKRGQVTLFIVLGIIILLVFLFSFYLVANLSGEPLDEQKVVVARSKLQSESLRYYVESCVKKAANDGLMQISNQGGFIFNGQPGSSISCTETSCTPGGILAIEGWKTPYLITPNPLLVPKAYPYLKFPCAVNMSWPYCRYNYDPNIAVSPFIGFSSLPHLYKYEGKISIQEQLEKYIEYKTDECIDFGGITNITGIPYMVKSEKPSVNLSITSYDLRVKVELPLKILGEGSYPVTEMQEYEVILPVRYGHFYSFVQDLINKESADPGFDIRDYKTLGTFWPGISVHVQPDKNLGGGDDLVIIRDDQSFIGQKMLEFRFIRANLPPVLNYTRGSGNSDSSDFIIYIVGETQQLDVVPLAMDANEDVLQYSYSQWGQQFFEKYIGLGQSQRLPILDHEKWMKPGYDPVSGAAYVIVNKTRDLGKHKFSIKAEDATQMYDLQTINISVWDAAMFTGGP